ncbi:phosphoglucomutase [Marinitoga hydrogenitolerans DSM 16785]|uniref:Phosphoglucomutase n=1 Tax=Marinitoga hydrogenitolerans (strain DSM 16785 / JCM 12826 / AT1271) TaxID=1122195 RepID=A0A1M4U5C1_MARH1|nr:phospho-sugar mutase [Marinitoga hydrogenitolerans]SHE52031.1 phosphoglucomutase [Marinitoga hydrogenitolerans DSM 16785]
MENIKNISYEKYNLWLDKADVDIVKELENIKNNDDEILDRFFKDLEFGTGGLRGKLGAGTNRMNIHTVARATQGFSNYLKTTCRFPAVVIAYDTRKNSFEFAKTAASVLAANGITVHIFKEVTATPILSFAVRYLKATGGIVITASHNPPEYNGYKIYTSDGTQAVPKIANKVIEEINKLDYFDNIKIIDFEEGIKNGDINWISDELFDDYINTLESYLRSLNPHLENNIKIVYTPLHGTGLKPVKELLTRLGFNLKIVEKQAIPDSNFSTVRVPNPEEKDAFQMALDYAKEINAHLVMATDPDSDRLGIYVKENDRYIAFTGNQIGVMLSHYILTRMQSLGILPNNGLIIKTIVTTDMIKPIAKEFNVALEETLTGFKFIGEKIEKYYNNGKKKFIFGFEESYGYLANEHARDKDAIIAAGLVAMLVSHVHNKNMSLSDYLSTLRKKYGYYLEENISFTLEGIDGLNKINATMQKLRTQPPTQVGQLKLVETIDYLKGINDLPKSNVVELNFDNKLKIIGRPSGTEPKIKFYLLINGNIESEAKEILTTAREVINHLMKF